jgi:tetratricopeptide (TPR) repeat protein
LSNGDGVTDFMKLNISISVAAILMTGQTYYAQPKPSVTPTPPIVTITSTLPGDPRVRREQAYAKLLEGQRYVWNTGRLQTQAGKTNAMKLAKAAFQKAVDLDSSLAEGYTALAELAVGVAPIDIEESIRLATTATKIEPDNFGGHRMLARLYTVKSRLNNGPVDPAFAAKAVEEWKQITRLDPRNAEGWAFLSAFTTGKNQASEQIEMLRNWISSASPLDVQFYGRVMGQEASLSPESATLKLGAALMKAGRNKEAVETLSTVIADDANNAEAISLLGEAIESSELSAAAAAIEGLQQAVYANPANVSLVDMLARLQNRTGHFDDAVKLLKTSADKTAKTDAPAASALLVSLGDLYIEKDRYNEAAESFENSLVLRGVAINQQIAGEDREFVIYVFEKLIQTYKLSDRLRDVRAVIERARTLFGKEDLFADRQLISFYRSTGNKTEALAATRAVRERLPKDNSFIRLEATLLAETGKVDSAVALIRAGMIGKTPATGSVPDANSGTISVQVAPYDAFSNHLFISNLYSKANRAKEAADSANDAFASALGSERKQIAKLTLASAQQLGGDFKGAETTLRDILKQTPGNPIALNNLGYFLVERDERIPEAVDLIQQALKVDPRNPSYLDSLGWAFFKLCKFDDAEKFLKDAARLDADSSTIQEHLGDVYFKKQNSALAKASWEKALKLAWDEADIDRLKKKLKN